MYRNPVIWSDQNQITGDSIFLLTNKITKKLDSLKVFDNAFIISKDSLSENDFNQIKGRNMLGKFEKNKLRTLFVLGNAESVYHNRNEQTQVLETITKEISSNIEFTLDNGQIETIKYLKKSDGKTYPPSMFPEDLRELKGFNWREKEQPKSQEDIFIKNTEIDKTPVKKKADVKKGAILEKNKLTKNDKQEIKRN